MLKYCNGCERDLEIDKYYSYKKSTCKECVNKKVKCEYCDKEFNSTNLSKHIKQIHSTYNTLKQKIVLVIIVLPIIVLLKRQTKIIVLLKRQTKIIVLLKKQTNLIL